nr:hypothetical protein [Tanacetum cinerariifolium]
MKASADWQQGLGTGNQDESDVNPTPVTHEAGGPSNTLLEQDPEDPIMQFVVHNFDRMNAMYKAFTQKLKNTPTLTSTDPPVIETWNSDSDDEPPSKTKENIFVESDNGDPSKSRVAVGLTLPTNAAKGRPMVTNDFYHETFIFKERDRDVRDLVASSFTTRIQDYDMPDGIKVPTNLRTYDGTIDLEDHLTVFIRTIDVHKLLEPACIDGFHQLRDKFKANFLQQQRFQKTQVEILGIRQRPDELLKDYVARFNKETLHMVDRSDVVVSAAFISGLRPGRLFKDLIAKPPTSMEDLFTQTKNFIRPEDANNENQEKKTMQPLTSQLIGFAGKVSWPLGLITLPITLYDYRGHINKTVMADFMVVRASSPYNITLGRPGMIKFSAVTSTLDALGKFQTEKGITVRRRRETSFHTEQGTFCYEKMPFGLKNAEATYQRLMDNMFIGQLGRNIEIYVDDMVIKSINKDNLIADIAETLDTLRKANMKLNPKKQVLLKPKNSRSIAKWAIELGEQEILYKPRSAVKGQILADFLTESPIITDPHEKSIAEKPRKNTSPAWTLFTDGAASLEGSGVGLILTDSSGQESVLVEVVQCRSIDAKAVSIIEETNTTWMDPIINYLTNGALPEDQTEARKIRIKAPQYSIKQNVLYRNGYLTPWAEEHYLEVSKAWLLLAYDVPRCDEGGGNMPQMSAARANNMLATM